MRISTQNDELTKRFGPERAAEIIMNAGFDAIDFSFYSVKDKPYVLADDSRVFAKKLKDQAAARGVVYNQAHAPFGGGFEHYSKNLVPYFPKVFEFSSALGVETIIVHPVQDGVYYGREEEMFYRSLEFYRSLAPMARDNGLKIGIENMWQSHRITRAIIDDTLANPADLARIYDELADPSVFTICLDIGHVPICRREPDDAIRTIGGERLGALHVHDVDYIDDCHTLPGMRKINWNAVTEALADIDYKGDFTLEADNFLINYPDELMQDGSRFMAAVSRYYANRVDQLRKNR